MSTQSEIVIRDCFVKLVDPTGRHEPVVSHHRVYDAERFIASVKHQHEVKARGDDRRVVSIVDEADYVQFTRAQKGGAK